MGRRYVIEAPDRDFFEHSNLYDQFYVERFRWEFGRWNDEVRLDMLEVVLQRLDGSKTLEDGQLLAGVQPLVQQMITFSEQVMKAIIHVQNKVMKERTAELIRRLLVDWTV